MGAPRECFSTTAVKVHNMMPESVTANFGVHLVSHDMSYFNVSFGSMYVAVIIADMMSIWCLFEGSM